MSPFYWGIIIGILIVANLGLIVVGLYVMAKRG